MTTASDPQLDQQLEQQLCALTAAPVGPATIWRRALAESKQSPAGRAPRKLVWRRWVARIGVVSCLGIVAVIVGIQLSTNQTHKMADPVGQRRYHFAGDGGPIAKMPSEFPAKTDGTAIDGLTVRDGNISDGNESVDLWALVRSGESTPAHFITPSTSSTIDPAQRLGDPAAFGERHVILKATIELTTEDVSKAFHKVQLIVNEGLGEYVQQSAMTGSGERARADLTLRVAAGRLGDVLQALRELGDVQSEHRDGQDVTAQVVNIEARLRNERRVETELLDLFDKRNDAPPSEILQLRAKLGEVRSEIERLTAQRDHLGRLVSLATVLVFIRTPEGRQLSSNGAGAYFADALGSAWQRGWTFLADTLALVFSVFVGGLIWWILIAIALLAFRRFRRRST